MTIPSDRAFTLEEAEAYIRSGNPAFTQKAKLQADESDVRDKEWPSVLRESLALHPDPDFYARWRAAFIAGSTDFMSDEIEIDYARSVSHLGDIYNFRSSKYNENAGTALKQCSRHISYRSRELGCAIRHKAAQAYFNEFDALFGDAIPSEEACAKFQVSPKTQTLRREAAYAHTFDLETRDAIKELHPTAPDYSMAKKIPSLPNGASFSVKFDFMLLTPLPPDQQEAMIMNAMARAGLEVSVDENEETRWKLKRRGELGSPNPVYLPDGRENVLFYLQRLNLEGDAGVGEVARCVAALRGINATNNKSCDFMVGVGQRVSETDDESLGINFQQFIDAFKDERESLFLTDASVRQGLTVEAGTLLMKLIDRDRNLHREECGFYSATLDGAFKLEQVPALAANAAGFKYLLLNKGWDDAAAWLVEQNPYAAEESTGLAAGANRALRGSNTVVAGVDGNPAPESVISLLEMAKWQGRD